MSVQDGIFCDNSRFHLCSCDPWIYPSSVPRFILLMKMTCLNQFWMFTYLPCNCLQFFAMEGGGGRPGFQSLQILQIFHFKPQNLFRENDESFRLFKVYLYASLDWRCFASVFRVSVVDITFFLDFHKVAVQREFFCIFCMEDATWALYKQTKTSLVHFSFCKDIRSQISTNSTPRSVSQRGVGIFFKAIDHAYF